MAVDFSGTWQLYEQSDPEEFLKALAVPELLVRKMREVKTVTSIQQNGDDFVICVKTPLRSNTNTFTIGKEATFCTMNGDKCKSTARMEGGKIIIETEKVKHVREMDGEDMVETMTAGSATLVRRSRRV